MKQHYLGKTGLRVSEMCLGCMTFGREADEPASHAMLEAFHTAGGTFLDTANTYADGASEEITGRWLKNRRREDFVVATKVRFPTGSHPNDRGLGRQHIMAAVDASLRRLGTDYIDLYQIHAWDPAAPLQETLSTLDTLVTSGKVRYLGASNIAGWQLQKAIDLAARHGWEPFRSLQPLYNLLERSVEWDLIPVCREEGLAVIPWSPLRGGWLSGTIRRGMSAPATGTRVETAERLGWGESWSAYHTDPRTWQVLDTLDKVADETGRPHAQIALNWLRRKPGVTAPILGARTLEQLSANLGSVEWELDEEHFLQLEEASAVEPPYPHNLIVTDPEQR